MVVSHKLSSHEVAALVDGLKDLDSTEDAPRLNGQEVRPYRLGADNHSALGDYYGLRMVNERFCRIARGVFQPFLRLHPRISGFPPEIKTFERYCEELENFSSLTISRIEELRGAQMIVLQPSFVSQLTDVYFGGDITHIQPVRHEFTATEHRVIEMITQGLNDALSQAWRDLEPLTFSVQSHEENLQFATFVDPRDMVINCSFILQLPNGDSANLDILYPLQCLKPLAAKLRSRVQSDIVDEDISWRDRLERAVMTVPLSVTARLAEPMVPLADLADIQPGQTLRADLAPAPQLLVEGQPLFEAEIGDVAGRAALSITRAIAPKS